MWARNLLFASLVLAGSSALTGALFHAQPSRLIQYQAPAQEPRSTVEKVDAVFRQQWAEQALKPAARASELTVARRLSLALTGSIPSLQEIRMLEALSAEQRLPAQLAYLLQDRRYADYWAERFARALVGTEDGPFLFYRRHRFVSWLSDQLLKNNSYDSMVRAIIASDGLWTDQPATNFVTVTYDPEKKAPNPERLGGRVARAFLGLRLDCAQCHNHPFEKWKQGDFQGLAAYFGQVQLGFTGLYEGNGDYQIENRKTNTKETVQPGVPFLTELCSQDGNRREHLAEWVTDRKNSFFARATVNRTWALMFGRPLVEPVDGLSPSAEIPPALAILAEDFAEHGCDLARLIRTIAATEVFQLESAMDQENSEAHEKAWAVFPMTRLRAEQVVDSVLQAASLETADSQSHILARFFRFVGEKDFVQRYGDTGEDEFDGRGGTIPQRLLLMNGTLVKDKTKSFLFNAATRIGWLAPDDASAVEIAYLVVLTRRPTPAEATHFQARLSGRTGDDRSERMEDLCWTLINSSEFSWNH
jgi:hypothetical protein